MSTVAKPSPNGMDGHVHIDLDTWTVWRVENGAWVCKNPSMVGEVKMIVDKLPIPAGWHVCDGKGGTIEIKDKPPKGTVYIQKI